MSATDPFIFFKKLILENRADELWNEFIPCEDTQRLTGAEVDLINRKRIFHSISEIDGSYEGSKEEDYIEVFFKNKIEDEILKIRSFVEEFYFNNTIPVQKGYLNELYRQTKYLSIKCASNLGVKESKICRQYLAHFKNYLDEHYNSNNKNKVATPGKICASFKFKRDIPDSKLMAIYEDLRPLLPYGFVDVDETSCAEFVEILTSKKLNNEKAKIILWCENVQAAYIFEKMTIIFDNFNPTSIGLSKRFINRVGKPLTREDLYTPKSKNKNPKDKKTIDKVFKLLQIA